MLRWVLPEYIQDALPAEAAKLENLRRRLLDDFRLNGYQLVAPPLLAAGFLKLLAPLVFKGLFGLLLRAQRRANFLDDVTPAVEYAVGTPPALLGQRVAADAAAAGGILAAIELVCRLGRVGQEQGEER